MLNSKRTTIAIESTPVPAFSARKCEDPKITTSLDRDVARNPEEPTMLYLDWMMSLAILGWAKPFLNRPFSYKEMKSVRRRSLFITIDDLKHQNQLLFFSKQIPSVIMLNSFIFVEFLLILDFSQWNLI